jgi:ABC-type multidrug transport system fused ATPase/permease subunit
MAMLRKRIPASFVTLRETLHLLYRSSPRAFVISAIASLPEPLFFPAFLLVLHYMLQAITGPAGQAELTPAAVAAGIGLVLLLLIQRLGIIVRDGSSTILRQEAWVTISKRIMDKLPAIPFSLFEDNTFQARYGLVIREAAQRSITLVDTLFSTGPILLGLLGLAVALFAIAPLMVLVLLIIAIPAARIERRFSQAMYDLQEHTAPAQLRMDALTNMQVDAPWQRDVRVYRSNLLGREHAHLADTYLTELKRLTGRFLGLRGAAALVQVVGLGLALAAAFVLIGRGQLSLAGLAVLVPGIALLSGMIGAFISHLRTLLESLRYAQTLFEFLTVERFGTEPVAAPAPVVAQQRLASIRLVGVSYTYPENQQRALADISCTLTPGMTAIVGTNGVGKSTLVKLVAGLVTPTTGIVQGLGPGGEEVALASCIKAVLFQDPGHFPFSIRHNVTMRFDRDPGEDEGIAKALRQAGLWEVVELLPDGLDTIVGAGFGGATDLSGGQWQRLALARLLYHDAPLIILDEPSASLDPVGERQIFALLSTLAREHQKIVLFTTHRYDTIRRADTIVVLVDGQIAEVGSHDELERKAGAFWSLYFGQEVRPAEQNA